MRTIIREKEGHYIMIKGSVQEKDKTMVNTYSCNIGTPQYIGQMLTAIKEEIDSNRIKVGVNTPLTQMDRSSRQRINKETQALNDTLDLIDLIDIYWKFHPKQQNTLSSQVHIGHSPEKSTSWVTIKPK